jgi:hypothetical protein
MDYENIIKPDLNFSELWDELNGGGELVGTLYGVPVVANRFVPGGTVLIKKGPLKWKFVRMTLIDRTL